MNSAISELLVAKGPLEGRRFTVGDGGLRLGRSSTCEISIPDPALSRNHCLFERRGEGLWVTDLASANGTSVSGVTLGGDSRELHVGDTVEVGDSVLRVVGPDGSADTVADLDLGLASDKPADALPAPRVPFRLILWGVAAFCVAVAAFMIMRAPEGSEAEEVREPAAPAAAPLLALSFEKVTADTSNVYRYALSVDAAGRMRVVIDDVPSRNRHIDKGKDLSPEARKELADIFARSEKTAPLYSLRPYIGTSREGQLESVRLRVAHGGMRAFSTACENAPEPDALRVVREKLEAFAKNELGLWAVQMSVDELLAKSEDARRLGDRLWEERDVQTGNLASSLAAYREAIVFLDTVNPKPAGYSALEARAREVERERDSRYRSHRTNAEMAMQTKDWAKAAQELRIVRELVPDTSDERNQKACALLVDVESRMKNGGRR